MDEVSRIGIFIESPRFIQHSLCLSKDTDIEIVTSSREVYEELYSEVDSLYFFNKEKIIDCMLFKRNIRHLSLDCIILFSDSSPVSYWIQKQFNTIMVFDDCTLGRDIFYYKTLYMTFIKRCGTMVNVLQFLFGPKVEINGKLYKSLPCKTGSILHFFKDRMLFGYKNVLAELPGKYSTLITVVNSDIKNAYLEAGISADVVSIAGSLEYDIMSSNAQAVVNNDVQSKAPDVVFFTQPFNKYSWEKEPWIQEVKHFVDDCEKNGVSFVLSLHPRDDASFYRKYVDDNYILDNDTSFEEKVLLIRSSKLVVVKSSTIINTVLALRKPIAYINYASFFPHSNMIDIFNKEMIMYKNNNVADILQYVSDNSTDIINHQKKVSFRAFPEIGNAKNNIRNVIQSSLDEKI